MISSKYKDLYLSTAISQLKKMSDLLISLEKKPQSTNLLENIFRLIHSMKGAAATMGFRRTVKLLHTMESVVDQAYRQVADLDKKAIDALFVAHQSLQQNIESIKKSSKEIYFNSQTKLLGAIIKKKSIHKGQSVFGSRPHILGSLPEALELNVSTKSLDDLQNKLDELFVNNMEVKSLLKNSTDSRLLAVFLETERLLGSIRRELSNIRVVPLTEVLSALPYMVREIARSENKEVELIIHDNNLSLDRAILDELSEILIQLIRNSIAHGITVGQTKGKIDIDINLENDQVKIVVSDNGRGIDWPNILSLAVKNKVISRTAAKQLNIEEIKNLIFQAGVSGSSENASTASGRGIGLSLVKDKVLSLGGQIKVESEIGKGAVFIVHFPLPLSIFRALAFRVGAYPVSLPLISVYKIVKLPEVKDLSKSKNYAYRQFNYRLVFMDKILGLEAFKPLTRYLVLLKINKLRIALPIYSNIKEEELVMKKTPLILKNIKYIKGVAVSSSGQVNIILDINSLI